MKDLLKIIGFVALIATLFASLFHIAGAELSNNVTAVALMVLLLSIFSDLREFNFWGLIGKRYEIQQLQRLAKKEGVNEEKLPKISKTKLQQVRIDTEVVTTTGNRKQDFLELTFEIERLLRTVAAALQKRSINPQMRFLEVAQYLYEQGVLTKEGYEQIKQIENMRNTLLQGRRELEEPILDYTLIVAENLYKELKAWVDNPAIK